jgi:hypothetical protein
MGENLDYLRMFARFPFSLRRFLQYCLTPDEAQRLVRNRMECREENFLRLVERSVYGFPRSPYRALLKMAGCELGDLRALVAQKGLEGALKELRASGVYVTYEELKGRKPIVRNQLTLPVLPRDFDNPYAHPDFDIRTGGSTGLPQSVSQNLDAIADEAPFRQLTLQAHGLVGVPMVVWSAFLPSGATFRTILLSARMRESLQQWFSPIGWRDSKYWLKYNLASVYMIGCIRACGQRVPFPQIVRLDRAEVVARYLQEMCAKGPKCVLHASMSRALRVCLAAQAHGLDLTNCVVWGGAEPATPAKVEQIHRACAHFISSYAMTEAGILGYGCRNAADATDVHLRRDALALIAYPHEVESSGITVPAFNITTLLGTVSKVLLNVEMDDYGIVEEKACGCEMESHGYTTHLRDIRSYGKLVGEGVTFIGNEMTQVLERTLPARFGGSALDYQLLEQEDPGGLTRLYLVISPRVEIQNEQQVLAVVHQALSASSAMGDGVRAVWKQAHTIQIKRQEPILTPGGKFMPLHIQRHPR